MIWEAERIPDHSCTAVQCTAVQRYSVQLYSCTAVQIKRDPTAGRRFDRARSDQKISKYRKMYTHVCTQNYSMIIAILSQSDSDINNSTLKQKSLLEWLSRRINFPHWSPTLSEQRDSARGNQHARMLNIIQPWAWGLTKKVKAIEVNTSL